MFKIFNIFKRSKKVTSTEENPKKELSVRELEAELNKNLSLEIEKINTKYSEISEKISKTFEGIRSISDELSRLDLPQMDSRLASRVKSSIEILTQKINSSWDRLTNEIKKHKDYEEFLKSKKNVCSIIEDVLKTDSNQSRIIAICFNKQIISLTDKLKILLDLFKELEDFSEITERDIRKIKVISSYLEELSPREKLIQSETERLSSLKKDLEHLVTNISNKNEKLKNIVESEIFIQGQIDLNLFRQKRDELNFQLRNNFSGIRKILNKFKHDFESSFSKEISSIIDVYCEDVVSGVESDTNLRIEEVLNDLLARVKDNSFVLQVKQKEKILVEGISIIPQLKLFLESRRELYSERDKILPFKNLENEVKLLKEEISREQKTREIRTKEIDSVQKVISLKEKELSEKKEKLISLLNDIGIKIKE